MRVYVVWNEAFIKLQQFFATLGKVVYNRTLHSIIILTPVTLETESFLISQKNHISLLMKKNKEKKEKENQQPLIGMTILKKPGL